MATNDLQPNDSGTRLNFPEHPQLAGLDTGLLLGNTAAPRPPEAPVQAGVGSISNITDMSPVGSGISGKGRETFSPLINSNPLGIK